MEEVQEKLSIADQIRKGLDGRTQLWLCFEIRMGENKLSRKLNGLSEWTDDELQKISARLGIEIQK